MKVKFQTNCIFLLSILIFIFSRITMATVYVDINAPGIPDGDSWSTAWDNLQQAVDDPDSVSEEIWVADGTYATSITLTSGRNLFGGFEGSGGLEETEKSQRDWNKNLSIIDGTGFSHVIIMDRLTTTTIDGFTITGGRTYDVDEFRDGAGILCLACDPSNSIRNNVITGNLIAKHARGAGIYCFYSSPVIENNIIAKNRTGYSADGAGIACVYSPAIIRNNIITSNFANTWGYGAGIFCYESDARIEANIITSNLGFGPGAGIHLQNSRSIVIDNVISGNRGDSLNNDGGGISCLESNDIIIRNIICGNKGGDYGGGVSCDRESPFIFNNTICDNTLYGQGGGGISSYRSSPCICNNIFARNSKTDILERFQGTPFMAEYNNFGGGSEGFYKDSDSTVYHNVEELEVAIPECKNNTGNPPLFKDPFPTTGTWTSVATFNEATFQTTLIDVSISRIPGELTGAHIFPDPEHTDYCFVVAGNTQTEITVWGDASGIAFTGLSYRLMDYHLQCRADGNVQNSPCIDAGDPQFECSNEPGWNGGCINQGAFGNTSEAARTGNDLFISGHVMTEDGYPVKNTVMDFTGGPGSVTTLPSGYYITPIPSGWSGSVTPVRNGCSFTPPERIYSEVNEVLPDQDFTVENMPPAIFVDGNAGGAEDGTSWGDAFTTLSAALENSVGGQEILMAAGTYYEDGIQLRSGITIRGGIVPPVMSSSSEQNLMENDENRTKIVLVNVPKPLIIYALCMYGDLLRPFLKDVVIVNMDINGGMYIAFGDSGRGGVFSLQNTDNMKMKRIIFEGNSSSSGGGAISARNSGNLYIENSKFISNEGGRGGAVQMDNSDVIFEDCFFQGNSSMDNGGALEAVDSDIYMYNSVVEKNTCWMHGGGFALQDCFFYAGNSIFAGNSADETAGGLLMNSAQGNSKYPKRQPPCLIDLMDLSGKGIRDLGPDEKAGLGKMRCAWLDQSVFSGNSGWIGGGASNDNCSTLLDNCVFAGNEADGAGGGVSLEIRQKDENISLYTVKSIFASNNAGSDGGGVYIRSYFDGDDEEKPDCRLENNTFSGNSVSFSRGGGLFYRGALDMTILNSVFSGQDNFDIWKDDDLLPLPSIRYNDLWGNPEGLFMDDGTNPYKSIEAMEAILPGATGNISADPLFVSDTFSTGTWTADAEFLTTASQTILADHASSWPADSLKGLLVIPDIDYSGKPFVIAGNSENQIFVWGDAGDVQAGDRYWFLDFHFQNMAGGYPENSPCIDAGDPASDYSNEPIPNGGRINLGPYGNTPEAARSGIPPRSGMLAY